MKTLNEKDKNNLLGQALREGESYKAKAWGCLMADTKTLMLFAAIGGPLGGPLGGALGGAIGALTNEYCYVGMTNTRFVFYVMETFDCSKVKYAFEVAFQQIEKAKVQKSLLPGRHVIKIYIGKQCLKLSLVANTIGTDIQNQKEGIEAIIAELKERFS
ncbi:MAG TPA: hypothetical protein VHO94_01770 [Oscillospiraceae bacterium]|nr:hypothetical protein [Oscillospiraceae bacterium]